MGAACRVSRFNPTEELEAEAPTQTLCPDCGQAVPRTYVHRQQLLGWQVDRLTFRCDDCRWTIRLTSDAARAN